MPLFLGLLSRFWKPLLGIVLIIAAWAAIVKWDNNRLEREFNRGQASVQEFYANEERRIKDEAEEIFSRNQAELFNELEALTTHNASLQKKIKDFNAKTTYSCSPLPEYLSLWDASNTAIWPSDPDQGDSTDDKEVSVATGEDR